LPPYMLQEAREPDRKESRKRRLEKRGKKKESFGLAPSLPNTGSLLQTTSGEAEKAVHECTPSAGNRLLRETNTKESPIYHISLSPPS
jgi:hypothetical protein